MTAAENLKRLKSAIDSAIKYATEEATHNDRARCFVAMLSGAIANIYSEEEGDKLFALLRRDA